MRAETQNESGRGLCDLAVLCDDAEDIFLQEAVVEGEDGRVMQLRQQLSLLRSSDRLVGSKVTQRNLFQHLPERDRGQRSMRKTRAARRAQFLVLD